MKYTVACFIFFYFLPIHLLCQNTILDTVYVINGDYINGSKTVNYIKYFDKDSSKILLLSKYIDTNKAIIFSFGTNEITIGKLELDNGFTPFSKQIWLEDSNDYFNLRVVKGQLLLNCKVFEFDGKYVGKIANNKLYTSRKDYELYATDHYIELFDDYNIPVLQIELDKKKNTIFFGGVFNNAYNFLVITKDWAYPYKYGTNKMYLSQGRRDSLYAKYLDLAKQIRPLHEK